MSSQASVGSRSVYILLALALALLLVLGVFGAAGERFSPVNASGTGPSHSPTHTGSLTQATKTCGFSGLPTCAPTSQQWITIQGTGSNAILDAARQSRLFNVNANGQGDTPSLAHLGNAQLVRAFSSSTVQTAPDYEDIPILTPANTTLGVIVCQLNGTHTALSVVEIVQYATPRPVGSIAKMSVSDAITAVATQRHTSLRPNAVAYLIYLPYTAMQQETGKIVWIAGGMTPDDPIWLIPGADGASYVVGADGHTYGRSELPSGSPS